MRAYSAEEREKWQELIREQGQSGQSAVRYCRERGLREWQFRVWKKRLREAETAQFVAVKVRPTESELPKQNKGIEIRISRGRSLVVNPGFDAQHLQALLAVLEGEA